MEEEALREQLHNEFIPIRIGTNNENTRFIPPKALIQRVNQLLPPVSQELLFGSVQETAEEREREREEEGESEEEISFVEISKKPRKKGKPGRRRRAKRTVNNGLVEQDTTRLDGDLEAHLKEGCPSLPVHNFSNRCFAPVVLAVLGLGLKFVPRALLRTREVEEEINRALDGLKRRLDLAFWFEDELETDPFIPPITSKRKWSPPAPGEWPQQKQAIAY